MIPMDIMLAIPHRNLLAYILCLLGGLAWAASYYAVNHDAITATTDTVFNAGFLNAFTALLHAGVPYPGWLPGMLGGTGAPVFVFYPPLSFYLGSLFALPRSVDPDGLYQLGLAMGASLGLRSALWFRFLSRHVSVGAALAISLSLILLPYNLTQMHVQVALAQILALAWFPLCLETLERWREKEAGFPAGFALAFALVALTHAPSALMFAPVLGLYGLLYRPASLRVAAKLLGAFLLASGLCAFYWLPAALNHDFVQTDHYIHLFSTTSAAFFDSTSYYTAIPILAAGIAAMCLHWRTRLAPALSALTGCALLALFLLLPLSRPLWDALPLLHLIQMPFRFTGLLIALLPVFLLALCQRAGKPWPVLLMLVALLPAASVTWSNFEDRIRQFSLTEHAQSLVHEQLALHYCPGEYRTIWMEETLPMPALRELDTLPFASVATGAGDAQGELTPDGIIHLRVSARTPMTLDLKQHYFPGWSAAPPLPLSPSPGGRIRLELPTGTTDATLSFTPEGRNAGLFISLASAALWLGFFLRSRVA